MAKNYTTEYQLCQWDEADVVSRVEFNQDNSRVEAGMVGLGDKITAAKTQFSVDVETLNTKVEAVDSKVDTVGTEVGTVESQVTSLQTTLETKLANLETTIAELSNQLTTLESTTYNSSNLPIQITSYTGSSATYKTVRLPHKVKMVFCAEFGLYALEERSGRYTFNQKLGTSNEIVGNPNTWCTETTTDGASTLSLSENLNYVGKSYILIYVIAD